MSNNFLKPGEEIGGFTVISPCGAGAFGQVYLVRDGEGRERALKVLSADRRSEHELDGLLRFRKVAHPNLLHIDRLSTLPDGRVFYTMDAADNAAPEPEYAPDTLARRMRERGSLPPAEVKRIMLELAAGLAELHRARLVHRDIKPENILFVDGRATLADAGAVGEYGGTTRIGTPDYLAPDVCLGKRDFAATDDCYALGKVLYSALTGEAPRKFPSTPRSLDPEAAALFRAAERACTPPGVSAYKFRKLVAHPEPPRRFRRAVVFAAVAVCLAIAVAAALTVRKRTAPPQVTPQAAPVAPPAAAAPGTAESSAVSRDEERPSAGFVHIRQTRPVRLNGAALVSEMKEKDSLLRARMERVRSPKAAPTVKQSREPQGQNSRDERGHSASGVDQTGGGPTREELLRKYDRSAGEKQLVDRWLAEYAVWVGRINRAGMSGNKTLVAELTAEMKNKLPYGIADFCGEETGIRKLLWTVSQGRSSIDDRRLELLLQYRRDALKKLLEGLPADELAKWR